jgi:tetratricopeptide (TPR) repeat protein
MSHSWKTISDIAGLTVLGALAIWGMWRWLKRTDDPARLVFKWILTIPAIIGFVMLSRFLKKAMNAGGMDVGAAFTGGIGTALLGLYLAAIWRRNISELIAKPFGSLYDGGSKEIEPTPFYSAARAHRKFARYRQAIAEIRAQLAKFPNDFEGHMMLAEIQAENMNDLQGAEITVQRVIAQPGHTPRNIAYALNTLADWHLKFAQDRELARQDLEKIIALLPDSEMSALAAQRIAHLGETEHLLAPHDRRKIVVAHGVENAGLIAPGELPKAPEVDLTRQASDYVKHLAEHPLDTEAREKLAVIYSDHFGRLDLATDQLEQLISHPNQLPKRVVHWLNLLADLQVKHACAYETVRATLQRIATTFPKSAAAENAASRIAHLKLELKSKQKSQAVQLGSYEQDIGLKRGLPNKL